MKNIKQYITKSRLCCGVAAALALLSFAACSDDDYSVATGNIITTVETGDAAVTATTATTQGTVLDLSKYASSSYDVGVVYGTAADPTAGGKKQSGTLSDGAVTTTLTGLTKGQTYYYATYVTLQGKVTNYGAVKQFTTTDATIAALDATNVTSVGATIGATVNADAAQINVGSTQIEYGMKIATEADDVATGVEFTAASADKTFTVDVSQLLPGRTYYYAAYFKMGDGAVYSDTKQFTTATKAMEYVDLGLSVMWAKYNLGAESELQTGGYYGYGDLTGLQTSDYLSDYATGDISGTANDLALALSAAIDGQAVNKSQLPTAAQWAELIEKTTQAYVTESGVNGVRFTAKNGNSIFLPAASYRDGTAIAGAPTDANIIGWMPTDGYYWTGNISATNGDYAQTVTFTEGQNPLAQAGVSKRSLGLSIRTVREADPVPVIDVDVTKLAVGDLEGNGRIRIEIYNEYGATKADPGINTNLIKFSKNMVGKVKLSGITGNLKEGAPAEYYAGWEASDPTWGPSLWSNFASKYDAKITGDGEYTLWLETASEWNGAVVFCIDIDQLGANLVDPSLLKVESLQLAFDVEDAKMQYYVDNSKIFFNNKDGNGTDGRIELFNEWGDTKGAGVDYSDLKFNGYMIVNFTISGIDGNLVDGASKSYKTELSFADQTWGISYWGGFEAAATTVTGDGTYEVWAPLSGDVLTGPVVWTIELYGLWKDLVDGSKVKATINKVIIPGKK